MLREAGYGYANVFPRKNGVDFSAPLHRGGNSDGNLCLQFKLNFCALLHKRVETRAKAVEEQEFLIRKLDERLTTLIRE